MNRSRTLLLYVLSVPYVAALAPIKGFEISGYRYTGFLWAAYLILAVLLILSQPRRIWFPWKIWACWFLFVALSISWSSMSIRMNLQALLQILTPLGVGIIASLAINNEHEWHRLERAFSYCLLILAAELFLIFSVPVFRGFSEQFTIRPAAMTLTVVAAVFVARSKNNYPAALIGWVTCLLMSTISGSRTATVVILLLWPLSPALERFWQRFTVFLVLCVVGIGLFYTPIFQQRFFISGKGSLTQVVEGDYDDSGRSAVWEEVNEESKQHPYFGRGVGESDIFVSKYFEHMGRVHNDYLRIKFEFGIIGLSIFFITTGTQLIVLWRFSQRSGHIANAASGAAFLAICAWLLLSYTDNGLIYGLYFTHPIFVLIGASYGLRRPTRKSANLMKILD